MNRSVHIAIGMALILSPGVYAGDPAAPAEVQTKLDSLEAQNRALLERVTQLEHKEGESWLNERRSEEVRALVKEVLSDADTRASLAEGGVTGGHDAKGFFLADEGGTFRLNIGGQIQARYIYDMRHNANKAGGGNPATDDNNKSGFEIRRARLIFSGYVGDPKFSYLAQLRMDRNTGPADMEIAQVTYKISDTLSVSGGRMKDTFLREEFTADPVLTTVERSLVNTVFTTDYVEGISFRWDASEMVRLTAGVNDGARSGNINSSAATNPNSPFKGFENSRSDVAFTGRADLKLAGTWKQMEDFNAWSGEPLGVFLGGAAHYEVAQTGAGAGSPTTTTFRANTDNFVTYTIDGSVEYQGLGVYGAFIGEHDQGTHGKPNLDSYGFLVQVNYMVIPDKLEPFIRYEHLAVDSGFAVGTDHARPINELTAGANYYFRRHASKFTLDVVWALDPLTPASTFGGAPFTVGAGPNGGLGSQGLLSDAHGESNQVTLRAQFQLMF